MTEPEPAPTPPTEPSPIDRGGATGAGRGVLFIAFAKFYFMASGLFVQIRLPAILSRGAFGSFSLVSNIASFVNNVVVTGTIQTVFPSVAVQSRTIRVEARVPNPGYGLKPGFSAAVRVPLARLPGSLVIPRSAVVRREGTENVFVLKGDRAELAPIQTGIETADRVEVVSGLGPTDRVIVSGTDTLRPGDRVQVKG